MTAVKPIYNLLSGATGREVLRKQTAAALETYLVGIGLAELDNNAQNIIASTLAVRDNSESLDCVISADAGNLTLSNVNQVEIAGGAVLLKNTNIAAGGTAFFTTPSSENLATFVTDETGTGSLVFATEPTIVGATFTASALHAEVTNTPTGTTQTITLSNGNHQTLNLASSSGNVTTTLTVPSNAGAGTIVVKQHGTTPRDITWAVSAGTFRWCGTEPTWNADAVSSIRVVSWRYDGSITYLASTEVAV